MKVNAIQQYKQVMNKVSLNEEAKTRIAKNCAKQVTLHKLKNRKFTVTAVEKKQSTDRI